MEEEWCSSYLVSSSIKNRNENTEPKLCLGRQSKATSKFALFIGSLLMLAAVSTLHSILAPLDLNLQMSTAQEQKQEYDVHYLERNIVHEHDGDVSLALAASKDDCPKSTKANQKADKSSIAWEVMPAKGSAGSHLKPATICACAKCGSSSFWRELFAIVHGRSFASMNYRGPPWIHDLSNKKLWTNIQAKQKRDWSNFEKQDSFALIRDPNERIVSAWKSKVGCDTKADIDDHRVLVPFLLNLAGSNITARVDSSGGFPCLDFSDYLAVLSQIHTQGKEGFLENHFLPQHLGCFKYAPPSMWTAVMTITDPNARCSLKSVVVKNENTPEVDNDCEMMKSHGSRKSEPLTLSVEDEVILDTITSKEYEMLAQHLIVE